MDKKEIFDETFDPNRSESYVLSIQVSQDSISFCINDTVREMYISLVSVPLSSSLSVNDEWVNTVGQFFSQYDLLSRKYKRVLLSFESPLYTIVPTEYFKPEKAKELFELVHPLPNLYEIRFNHLLETKSTVIFAIPSSLTSQWLFRQPQTLFYGHPSALVTYSGLMKATKDEAILLSQFSEHFFINVISKNNELQLCNSFSYVNSNDTAYHIINTCKLLGIDPGQMEIEVAGSIKEPEELLSLLVQYFRRVHSGFGFDKHNYAYSITKYKNSYWNLFNLSLCE
jgi:hypothetical protein